MVMKNYTFFFLGIPWIHTKLTYPEAATESNVILKSSHGTSVIYFER